MKVRITTSRWDQRTPKGIVRRRAGDTVTVKDDVADWLLRAGAAEPAGRPSTPKPEPAPDPVDDLLDETSDDEDTGDRPDADDAEPTEPEGASDEESEGTGVDRPAQSAPKADWVAYAVARGVPAKEAEAMDKPKLISRAG